MTTTRSSWQLFRASVVVLRREPTLLVFPFFSGISVISIALVSVATFLVESGARLGRPESWGAVFEASAKHGAASLPPALYIGAALAYLVGMFLTTFVNVAFFHEIFAALRGTPVAPLRGVRFAASRLRSILLWSLLAGLVGLLIKAIESRLDFVGRLVAQAAGLAWSVTSVFAIPAIVVSERSVSPRTLLKRSADVLKKTWGEALIGYVGIQLGVGLVSLGLFGVFLAGIGASIAFDTIVFTLVALAAGVSAIFVLAYVSTAAEQVYKAALFLHASEGMLVAPYDRDLLQQAWRTRR